jgi:hypothetical protein
VSARVHHFLQGVEGSKGRQRIHADVADEGCECSPEVDRNIMRDGGLPAVPFPCHK